MKKIILAALISVCASTSYALSKYCSEFSSYELTAQAAHDRISQHLSADSKKIKVEIKNIRDVSSDNAFYTRLVDIIAYVEGKATLFQVGVMLSKSDCELVKVNIIEGK